MLLVLYIYIYTEREREREIDRYAYTYIYIYIEREREGGIPATCFMDQTGVKAPGRPTSTTCRPREAAKMIASLYLQL